MSQLLIGNKFASGRHSRIYRGIYKQRDVAIKIISRPEEDDNLANFLEKQFISEAALLFHLKHLNIITVSCSILKKQSTCGIICFNGGRILVLILFWRILISMSWMKCWG